VGAYVERVSTIRSAPAPNDALRSFFDKRGWRPFPFQKETWRRYAAGQSGLVHAPTGIGKTYAAFGGPVFEGLAAPEPRGTGLRVLWVTPLRALGNDTADALRAMLSGVQLDWDVELRHGDIPNAQRQRQRRRLPPVLVTTPESLTLLLSYADAAGKFAGLQCVVCDEWHELMGSKRGVQTELALARLRTLAPQARCWGLSATIGNLNEALSVLLGSAAGAGALVQGLHDKVIEIETLTPDAIETFPWSGHLGLKQTPLVIEQIKRARSTLVFTNTRSQAELWHQALLKAAPYLASRIAVHHGSLDRDLRTQVEAGINDGTLQAVVCTSSLDLGVDFSPVEQVIQIGSPKGIARLVQRAGRSGHQPGAVSRIFGVPTNALEIIEFAAAREAVARREIESRPALRNPLDVLLQHVVTIGLNGGVTPDALRREIMSTAAFQDLRDEDWQWVLGFAQGTVGALTAYPEYQKVAIEDERLTVPNPRTARMHRMSIGTIVGDAEVLVKYSGGGVLGQIEERFAGRLKPGDRFHFAGKLVELIRFRGMVATVKRASQKSGPTPSWQGGRSPLSSELAAAVSREIDQAANEGAAKQSPEIACVAGLLAKQAELSAHPGRQRLLVEYTRVRRTHNAFFYPFAGRLVHEGLAAICAFRLSRQQPITLKTTINDYGFSLQAAKKFTLDEDTVRTLLTTDRLTGDLMECLNTTELARRQFREISRVAGLVFQGYPRQQKSMKNLQMSSGLLYDVFVKYDPDNRLVWQAKAELLERQLEQTRLLSTLEACAETPLRLIETPKLTPFAFPLWAEGLHDQVSSESWTERVAAMAEALDD